MEIKITKKTLLKEGLFGWRFYLVYGKIYNDEKTRFRKFKFVVDFDDYNTEDFFDGDENKKSYKEQTKEYLNILIDDFLDAFLPVGTEYNDAGKLAVFYENCNNTIIAYNERFCK